MLQQREENKRRAHQMELQMRQHRKDMDSLISLLGVQTTGSDEDDGDDDKSASNAIVLHIVSHTLRLSFLLPTIYCVRFDVGMITVLVSAYLQRPNQ